MSTVYSAGEAKLTIVPSAEGFRQKLEADLRKIQVDYAVQISADLARARADLDKFRAEQEAKTIHLRAEVDRNHLRQSFDSVRGDLANVGETLGRALKIDAATVGIDLLPAMAAGLVSVAQALEQVADAGLAVPGILAGVGASVGTLALGLGGVKDAWSAVTKAADVSASGQARSAEQVTSATNALRNAVVDEAKAQKDVADARKEARQQLEDLNIEVRGGALSEKEAILEAAKARRDLATGRYKDALDYQSAQLRVEEADQRVVESRQHNIELQQKVSDANAKGIEGSDRVVEANERLVRSHQSVQAAAEALSTVGSGGAADKAAEALAKLAPNAREFVQAMISLKPAFKDLRDSDAQNLFAGMGGALKTLVASDLPLLKSGIGNIATAINADLKQLFGSLGSDSTKGLIDRVLGNTANADARIKGSIDPLVHAFGVLTAAGSDTLPRLADAFDRVAERFDKFITAAAADGRLSKWINDGLTAFTHLGEIALHLGETFHGLTKALGGEGLLGSLDRATGRLAAFVNSADGQQKLIKFFQDGRDEFHKWEPVIDNLAKMLPPLFQSAKDNADAFLPTIKGITDVLAKNPGLVKAVADAYLTWETIIKPVAAVAKAITGLTELYGALRLAALGANGAMAAASVGGGAGGALGGAGAAAGGIGAGLGGGLAVIGPGLAAGVGASVLEQQIDKNAVPFGGDPNLVGGTRNYTEQDVAGLTVPPGFPKPGSPEAELAMSGLARTDPAAKWVVSTQNKWDQAARYAWLMNHPEVERQSFFQPPNDYLTKAPKPAGPGVDSPPGGDAGFAAGGPTPSGRGPGPTGGFPIEVHGDEYVISAKGRASQPDSFWHAANQGKLPGFEQGGAVDIHNTGAAKPLFAGEGPDNYGSAYAHNRAFAKPSATNYQTKLTPRQEQDFRAWVTKRKVPFDPDAEIVDYDMRGFWLANGGNWSGGHFTDEFKTPYDTTFSAESMYATSDNPFVWSGDNLIDRRSGRLVYGAMPGFDVGGPVDLHQDPRDAAPNPATLGPQPIAPNPTGSGGGILNNLVGGIASGVQGPIGNVIGLIQQGASMAGQGGSGGGGGGGGMIPGIWGLAQAGGNPDAMNAWAGQTANWLGNFGAKTAASVGQIGLQGVLGGLGLSGLSAYGPPLEQTAGFYLGDQSPFRSLGGGSGADLSGGGIGSQTITLPTGETIQVPTSGTAQGSPAGVLPTASDNTASPAALRAIQYAQIHAVGQPYSYGGVGPNYDCSGIASAIYAAAKGLPQGTRYFTTESDFTSLGFTPGYQPGALNIGVMRGGGGPNSHMVLTLPNGVNVESGGASDTTQYGGGAKGARDLPLQFHLTLPGAMPPSGGIPGLPAALYDEGGAFPSGTVAFNNSGKPEAVLTNEQHQALQTVAQHLTTQTQPSQPQGPDAQHLQTPQPAPSGPIQPPSTPATPIPSPGGAAADVPASTPSGGHISPSLAAPSVAPPPSSLDHNLKAIDTGIDSGAQAIGQAVSTAIGIAGGAAGGFGGGAISAIGPYVSGLIQEGGKVTKDVVNIASSFLVGDVTGGTQDLAYGAPLRPAQNTPNVAPGAVTNWNISGNYELRSAMDQAELKHAQDTQTAFAGHGRITP